MDSLQWYDADYKFIYVDIGVNGAGFDAGIINDTELEPALEYCTIGLMMISPYHISLLVTHLH